MRLRDLSYVKRVRGWASFALKFAHPMNYKSRRLNMEKESIMEELWRIKEEIAAQYDSFKEYSVDMLRLQAIAHPDLASN